MLLSRLKWFRIDRNLLVVAIDTAIQLTEEHYLRSDFPERSRNAHPTIKFIFCGALLLASENGARC